LLVAALAILLPFVVPELKKHIVVYEGPCTYQTNQMLGAILQGYLYVSCGSRSAKAIAYHAADSFPPVGATVEVPCKLFMDGNADCDFRSYKVVRK